MLNASLLIGKEFPQVRQSYDHDDVILYALALGAGSDPLDAAGLAYVYESAAGGLRTVPSMAASLAFPPPWGRDPEIGADWRRVMHVEQRIEFHRELAAQADVHAQARVVRVTDKGASKGALVQSERTLVDQATGLALADITMVSLARGDGGCGDAERENARILDELPGVPQRQADSTTDIDTSIQAALLYRLSGDRNPLHADPAAARAAGFDRPILHGLCTFGIACHQVVSTSLAGDTSSLRSFGCRFSGVVYPGEQLRVEQWRETGGVHFRVRVPARAITALDRGFASTRHSLT